MVCYGCEEREGWVGAVMPFRGDRSGDVVNGGCGGEGMSSALVYMVRISDSHSDGPGSIPGCGTFY